jgi:vitamin B12 transporter
VRVYLLVSLMLKNEECASACVRNPVGQITSAVALILALSGTGHAADSVLPVTVVTASRFEQSIEEVVSDMTVIHRAEIERYGAVSLSEILSRLPGIQSVDTGSPQLFIRGANANMTVIYVDGVRIDPQDKASGNPRLDLIKLAQVQRIEILRGPASDTYGAKAMGGVIQIFTDGAPEGIWTSVGAGSEALRTIGFGAAGPLNDLISYRIGFNRSISDGYDTQTSVANIGPTMPWHDSSVNVAFELMPRTDHKIRYVINSVDQYAESNDKWATYGLANVQTRSKQTTSGLTWFAEWRDQWRSQISVNGSRVSTAGTDGSNHVTTGRDVSMLAQHESDSGTLSVGLESKLDQLEAAGDIYNLAIAEKRRQIGASVGWAFETGGLSWKLSSRFDDDEKFGGNNSNAVGVSMPFGSSWRVSAGVGTAFRAPTIEQTTGSYGSATLRPEVGISKEVRLAYTGGDSSAELAIYRSDYRDMFGTSGSACAAGMFCYINVSRAKVEGLTLGGKIRVGVATLSGHVDVMRARNSVTGKLLNYRPKESATVDLTAPIQRWSTGAQWRGVGQRYYASGASVLRGYALLDLHASRPIGRHWTLQTRVENAANRTYDSDGYNAAPERRWFVGLKWQGY